MFRKVLVGLLAVAIGLAIAGAGYRFGQYLAQQDDAAPREWLERLLHPDFHEVGRSGARYTRQAVIDFLADRGAPPQVIAYDHRIEQLAADVALLHFGSHEVAADGTHRHAALRMSVWRRTSAGWQPHYHQGTPTTP